MRLCTVGIVSSVLEDENEYETGKADILQTLAMSHQDVQRDFMKLVIAEYKENTYLCMIGKLDNTELDILDKYDAANVYKGGY